MSMENEQSLASKFWVAFGVTAAMFFGLSGLMVWFFTHGAAH
jgi:hypothetical protein